MRTSLGVAAAVIGFAATAAVALVPPQASDSRVKDRDGDGLSNRFELRQTKTNPRKRDTDEDGLGDRYELRRSKTNPRKRDTDGDGLDDRYEQRRSKRGPPTNWPFPPPKTWNCTRSAATPSELGAQWSAARPGETICLTSGDFGTFEAGSKAGVVAVRPREGALPRMSLDFTDAVNVLVQGVTLTGGSIGGSSRNVTLAQNRFTSSFLVATRTANANVVLDGNTHVNIDATELPGRVTVWATGTPSGVTVQNSLLQGGDADGVRPDGEDVQVLNNEFADFVDKGGNHADPIQFYGARRAVVRGNYFHNQNGNISAYIMQADGGDHNVIERNVFAAGKGVGYGITLYSDNGSVIRHNTWQRGTCDFRIRCGTLALGNKEDQPVGRGTVIMDNILAAIGGERGTYTATYNLTQAATAGTGNRVGTPSFLGPMTAYAGYRLAMRSRGKGRASDGTDVGIR